MNRDWVLFHLREVQDELNGTIAQIDGDPDYDVVGFIVAMQHLYHHLNTAWNSRDQTPARIAAGDDDDFYAWRRFPDDIFLGR